MIRLEQITCRPGGRVVLRDVSLDVAAGERVSVVGPNGAGKSTLLRVAAGELAPDSGRVALPHNARVGFLRQSPDRDVEHLRAALPALRTTLEGDAMLARAAMALAAGGDDLPAREREYDDLLDAVARAPSREEIAAVARAMDADLGWFDAPPGTLSGGEVAKLALLDLVAAQPDVLLLDEPTNHLDLAGIEWLEGTLEDFPGPALIVSHDRVLLDAVSHAIVALDATSGTAETWRGDYTSWAAEQARRVAEQWRAYEREEREERRLRRVISAIESRSRNVEQRTIHFHYRKRAKKVARRATTLKARLEREAASGERTERPDRPSLGLRGAFTSGGDGVSRLVEVADATLAAGDRVLLEHVHLAVERGRRVFVVGPNGSGKSTLLRAVLGEVPVRAGIARLAASARPGVLRQEASEADWPGRTPVEVIRRTAGVSEVEATNLLHRFVMAHDVARQPIARLSEGERRRLQLAMLIVGGANLLVLDEPTNHLDLPSREAFEAALDAFDGAVLAVSHDRYFVDRFADEVWAIEDGRLVGGGV